MFLRTNALKDSNRKAMILSNCHCYYYLLLLMYNNTNDSLYQPAAGNQAAYHNNLLYIFAVLFSVKILMIFLIISSSSMSLLFATDTLQSKWNLWTLTLHLYHKWPRAYVFSPLLAPFILLGFSEAGCPIELMLELLLASISTSDKC